MSSVITKSSKKRTRDNFLIQRLSVAVQRGNSASVLGTMDVSESLG